MTFRNSFRVFFFFGLPVIQEGKTGLKLGEHSKFNFLQVAQLTRAREPQGFYINARHIAETGQKRGWWQTCLPYLQLRMFIHLGARAVWEAAPAATFTGGNRGISRLSLNGDPSNGQQVGSTGGTGQGS